MKRSFKRLTAGLLVIVMISMMLYNNISYAAPEDGVAEDNVTEDNTAAENNPGDNISDNSQTDDGEDKTGKQENGEADNVKSGDNKSDAEKQKPDKSSDDISQDGKQESGKQESGKQESDKTEADMTEDVKSEDNNSADPASEAVTAEDGSILVASLPTLQSVLDKVNSYDDVNIILSGDIVAEAGMSPLTIPSGVSIILDMAGHNIDRGLTGQESIADGYVIHIMGGGRLKLIDSTDNPGCITGGSNTGNGGGILCDDTSELTLDKGVRIKGNRARYGGGIYLGKDCELILGTCEIAKNDVVISGGGIYGGYSHISFLGGKTKVKNNTKGEDTDNDLFMPAGMEVLRFWTWSSRNEKTRKAVYSEPLSRGSRIGIMFEENIKEISDGYGKCNPIGAGTYFYCNDEDYIISPDNKKSEVTIVRNQDNVHNNIQTVLEIYKDGKLKSMVEYNSFTEAFDKALSGDGDPVITLGGDYASDSEIVVSKNKNITIDLNGHYIKRNRNYETKRNGGVLHVKEDATLTIKDSHPKKLGYNGVKGGVITGGASSNGGGGITVDEDGHLIMEGGTIYDCVSDEDGGGVYIDTGSSDTSFTMTGGRIYNCRALESADECFAGGIFFGDGKLDISNATIDNCYSEDDGGALFCRRGVVHLDNVVFSGNRARERGGAIYIDLDIGKYKGTTLYSGNCTYINNYAGEDGGAVCTRDNPEHNASLMFDRCVFTDNEAVEDGGAIEVLDDGLVLSNVEITNNKAGGYGGGVFVDSRYDINLKGIVVIKDNTSEADSNCNDLALEDGTSTTAYVYSGGLVKGSWIGIGSTDDDSIRLANKMSVYEMKYFHVGTGSIGAKKVETIDVDMAITASIFSVGKLWNVLIFGSTGLIAALLMIIYGRMRRRAGFRT